MSFFYPKQNKTRNKKKNKKTDKTPKSCCNKLLLSQCDLDNKLGEGEEGEGEGGGMQQGMNILYSKNVVSSGKGKCRLFLGKLEGLSGWE